MIPLNEPLGAKVAPRRRYHRRGRRVRVCRAPTIIKGRTSEIETWEGSYAIEKKALVVEHDGAVGRPGRGRGERSRDHHRVERHARGGGLRGQEGQPLRGGEDQPLRRCQGEPLRRGEDSVQSLRGREKPVQPLQSLQPMYGREPL